LRILIVSNFFPPHHFGGYELGCAAVADLLRARGHVVHVLTSNRGVDAAAGSVGEGDENVSRTLDTFLHWYEPRAVPYLRGVVERETHNQAAFLRTCDAFLPDIVYVWNVVNISLSCAFLAHKRGLPVCYFVSDHWLSRWERDPWCEQARYVPRTPLGRGRKRWVREVARSRALLWPAGPLPLDNVQFCSRFLKRHALKAGKPVENAAVIHWGVDEKRYVPAAEGRAAAAVPPRLLYAGQIAPHKGVHTAIEALNLLVREPGCRDLTLTIAGSSDFPDYEAGIRKLVRTLALEKNVRFTGMLDRDALCALYASHEILLFTSTWEEPFAITPLEAMACGLAVVGTTTGGSLELLSDEENALVFPANDSRALAKQTLRLLRDMTLLARLGTNGRALIEQEFTFSGMVDKIEALLQDTAAAARAAAARGAAAER